MTKNSIKFSIHNLLLEDKIPQKALFASIKSEFKVVNEQGPSGIAKFENADGYIWMSARSGRNYPYSAEVLNIKTKEREDNPRDPDQAELRIQGFCLYNYETGLLYTAGERGLDYFKEMLRSVNPSIKVRNIYKTRKELIESLKSIEKIRFVAQEDLLTWNKSLFSAPRDALGLGNPRQIKVEYKFPYVKATEKFKSFMKEKGFGGCDDGTLKSLVVAGAYQDGDKIISSTFNLKNFESSITVNVSQSEDGMFQDDEVKMALMGQIGL